MSKTFFLFLATFCMVLKMFIGRVSPIYNPEIDNYEAKKPTP